MSELPGETTRLVNRLRGGDDRARADLIGHACDRLRLLTRRMLRTYPGVRRWEQTDDVLQNALLRLCRALEAEQPATSLHFWRLAALQTRRELIDLARHHRGPEGLGGRHHTDPQRAADDPGGVLAMHIDGEPASLEEWGWFHEQVEALPEEEREVFGLLWYEGLEQEEAARVLCLSPRTVKRRWQSARIRLDVALSGRRPC
jgi:RNA polymerase sigma-70 factor (ECF subfamily)